MKRFNIFCTDSYFNEDRILHLLVFDNEKNTIFELKAGNRQDVTKTCKKMYDTNNKKNDWYNSKQGAKYYRALVENEVEKLEEIMFKNLLSTDDEKAVNHFVLDTQIKQLQDNLKFNIGYTYL